MMFFSHQTIKLSFGWLAEILASWHFRWIMRPVDWNEPRSNTEVWIVVGGQWRARYYPQVQISATLRYQGGAKVQDTETFLWGLHVAWCCSLSADFVWMMFDVLLCTLTSMYSLVLRTNWREWDTSLNKWVGNLGIITWMPASKAETKFQNMTEESKQTIHNMVKIHVHTTDNYSINLTFWKGYGLDFCVQTLTGE